LHPAETPIKLRAMQKRNTAELRCKYCNSPEVVKAGTRKLRCGVKQLYKCSGCLRKFSNLNRNAKTTDPAIILKSLILVCRGYSYEQASRFILRKYQKLISTSVISKWVKEYNPPYLRRMLKVDKGGAGAPRTLERARSSRATSPEQTVISHVFTHRDLDYNFQVHQPKLAEVPLPELKDYLLRLPQIIRHEDFETAARCSQIKLEPDLPVKQSKGTQASKDALKALQFAKTNFQRHDVVENFMLNCDCYTVASEVPVWMDEMDLATKNTKIHEKAFACDKAGGTPAIHSCHSTLDTCHSGTAIAGHIDLLQWKFDTLYILDFKPNAAKEQKAKVATQLNLYAVALSVRTGIPVSRMRCAWFDEEDFFSFSAYGGSAEGRKQTANQNLTGLSNRNNVQLNKQKLTK
jgi:transposase-like protein